MFLELINSAVAAMATSLGTMDWISGGVIAALVILNVSVGAFTEWQAEKVRKNIDLRRSNKPRKNTDVTARP